MIPPPEPVPAEASGIAKSARKTVKKTPATIAVKPVRNPRQDDKNRPVTLKAARRGKPDRLTEIDGIGLRLQSKLFALGVFHYDQIAAWSVDEAKWVSEEIGFPGRAHREDWGKQAAALVKPAGGAAKPKVAGKKVTQKAPAKTSRTGKSG
jgi:predicted flap endonuclease-1-like 5' DNA nuclease